MVDVMSSSTDFTKSEDFEDGELPEDGEIQDEEETNNVVSPSKSSPSNQNSAATTAASNSSPVKKFSHRGYGEDIETVSRDWENDSNDVDYRSAEDKDYRMDEDNYGDMDYRQVNSRRRRHSPTDDDYDPRAKRSFGRPYRPYHKPKRATEHLICKFFREGYCRDGDNCSYSHQAEDSLRKPELCRFYQQGFCKKGLTCLGLHGEFPCKAFHKGECSRDPCHFSHQPLTDYTRPLVERLLAEDELVASRPPITHFPGPPSRRRVLLPQGPSAPPVQHQAPVIHAPIPQQQNANGQLAPPSVVVPTLAVNHNAQYQTGMQGNSHGFFSSPAHAAPEPAAPTPQFDITQMLAQIAGESTVDDSPASPPMSSSQPLTEVCAIPENSEMPWSLTVVDVQPAYTGVDATCASSNDPRISRVISSQFDAVSSLIANSTPQTDSTPATFVRDPRRRPDERKSSDEGRTRISSWMPNIDR